MTRSTIVFDLDGTLVDTAPDLVATLNHVLTREGLGPIPYEAARNMVGRGARVMLERGLHAKGRMLPSTDVDRLERDFIDYYAGNIAVHSRPFAGVEATLSRFADNGYRLAVCTNKLEWLSTRLLDALGLSPRFSAICGPDTFGFPKPDPRILLATINRAGGSRDRTVMVGDSITDIATARAAAVPVIVVNFGYTDIPVRDLDADDVIGAFAELPAAVTPLLGQPVGNL
jgi:phosphoglycolate phosphatase